MPKNLNTPFVSVIIPTYNRAWTLKKAIDSVLEQDYKNFELIVIDDGSTDDTEALVAEYAKSVKFIQQPNLGVSAARNKGISISSGSLITFLDSDDYWYPEKLSAQVKFFNANPDALICQTEEVWIRNGKKVNPKKKHQKLSGMIFESSLALCLVSPSAVMMRKILFAKVDTFDESLPACEDYDLWLRITCRYPVHLIDTPLIVKTGGHEDQLSGSIGLDKYRIYALKKILKSDFLSESQFQAAENMLKKKCRIYADGCMKHGRKTVATYYYRLAEEIDNNVKLADRPNDVLGEDEKD
jgi:glycosyltransferase involved in cell wall biosynthesis